MSRLAATEATDPVDRTGSPRQTAAGAPEGGVLASARIRAVFTLRGDGQQIAERAARLSDRLQQVAIACEEGCDLDVSLEIQAQES